MDRKEELEFMLKGAEVEILYACKAVCENGLTPENKAKLDYVNERYSRIHCSLLGYEQGVSMKEVESDAE